MSFHVTSFPAVSVPLAEVCQDTGTRAGTSRLHCPHQAEWEEIILGQLVKESHYFYCAAGTLASA